MKYFSTLFGLLTFIFFTVTVPPVSAQSIPISDNSTPAPSGTANPTFGVIAPCPSCAAPTQTPPVSGGVAPSSSVNPSSGVINPSPIQEDPCTAGATLAHKSKHWKPNGGVSGLMEALIRFFIELLNLLLRLFGGSPLPLPEQPNEGNPQPEEPDPVDPAPEVPCEPQEVPTLAPQPTSSQPAPSISEIPSPSTIPSTAINPSQPAANPADRIFTEDFEAGNLSQWSNQSCPTGVTIVSSPVRKGTKSAKFTVADGDTKSKCSNVPTDDPRAQLVSDGLFKENDDYYIGFSVFFPTDFPTPTDWFQIAEIYGPPFGGSPSMGIDMVGNRIGLARDETHGYDTPWVMTRDVAKGTAWEDIILHIKFSPNPTVGFVEIWHNGVKQTFKDGSQKLFYATLANGINWSPGGTNSIFINQYRSRDSKLGTVTIYHDEVYVGKTYESVVR